MVFFDSLRIRFANLAINDLTFLLDEVMEKIAAINNTNPNPNNNPSAASNSNLNGADDDMQGNNQSAGQMERIALSCLTLATASLGLLADLTRAIVHPWMVVELGDRLPAMLLLNLLTLTGPRCGQLKVKNRQSPLAKAFQPRSLVYLIGRLLLNMSRDRKSTMGFLFSHQFSF